MPPASPKGGRPRTRPMRDSAHAPISVHEVAQSLPARTYRQVSWRQGSDATLSSRFAAVRVRAAHNRQAHDEQWLLIEWPPGESEPSPLLVLDATKANAGQDTGCHGTRPMAD
ncbi:hypothetical protein LL916_20030 [Xanthomonas oryzae]|nr:hypothetical protein LL916_20030 [Xanthomonas oryzae]